MKKALIVIPTYNERANLPTLIPAVLAQDKRLQVLVVDDASPDGTGKLAEQLKRRFRGRVHVMHRQGKLGLGSAYVDGFKWGLGRGYDALLQMDADFSHAPDALPGFLSGLEEADVVVGTRYQGGRISVVNWPLRRLALSMGASMYVRVVTGLPLSDCTGGFKAWKAEVLKAVDLDKIKSDGYSFQIEMNYKAWKKGFQFKEVPIIFNDRTQGSVQDVRGHRQGSHLAGLGVPAGALRPEWWRQGFFDAAMAQVLFDDEKEAEAPRSSAGPLKADGAQARGRAGCRLRHRPPQRGLRCQGLQRHRRGCEPGLLAPGAQPPEDGRPEGSLPNGGTERPGRLCRPLRPSLESFHQLWLSVDGGQERSQPPPDGGLPEAGRLAGSGAAAAREPAPVS